MVEYNEHLDDLFRALGDPTRRAMLAELKGRPRTVGELAQPFTMSLAGASKHVQVLEKAQLITREKKGRSYVCTLNAQPMAAAFSWLEDYARFWSDRLDILEKLLEEERDHHE